MTDINTPESELSRFLKDLVENKDLRKNLQKTLEEVEGDVTPQVLEFAGKQGYSIGPGEMSALRSELETLFSHLNASGDKPLKEDELEAVAGGILGPAAWAAAKAMRSPEDMEDFNEGNVTFIGKGKYLLDPSKKAFWTAGFDEPLINAGRNLFS